MTMNPNSEPFIVFGSPRIEEDEIQEVVDSLRSGWLGTGPKVAKFEQEFRRYKGEWGHPVAVGSCTAALQLALIASGVGEGDEVITTPMTFCATVNAIIHTGATPVLADIDPDTLNIAPAAIQQCLNNKTKAILPVHFAGRACDMDAICTLANQHDLILIEDCAHAIETTYRGQHVGTFGDFGCYSFYVTKNLSTGEGGMVVAREAEFANRIKMLGLHGMSQDAWKRYGDEGYKHYQVVECGFKYNMMDLQAALGIHQLRKIDRYWQRRQEIWNAYNTAFKELPLQLPAPVADDTRHAYHLYTVMIDQQRTGITRDEFLDAMTQTGIGVGVHYLSIPEHPYYQRTFGWHPDQWPQATRIGRQTISLPISAKLTPHEVDRVIHGVRTILGKST